MTDNQDLRTVRDTNHYLRSLIETPDVVKDYFWIGGIVTRVYQSQLGHTYFAIKDEQYSISCMLPNRNKDKAVYLVKDMMVDIYGVIGVYAKEANLQFIVSDVRPVELDPSTLDLNVLTKLEQDGLYPHKKKDLPENPEKIGLVTSKSSEALRDFKYVYQEQSGKAQIELMDVLVQGQQAPEMIAQRIKEANYHRSFDIIVLTRGGGRSADLATFNSMGVAEAICKSDIPIVTGIGHQRDETIADRVADQKTISPTDAAYKLARLSQIEQASTKIQPVVERHVSGNILISSIILGSVGLIAIILMMIIFLQL